MDSSPTDDNTTGLRVASFACYLDSPKDTLLHKISPRDITHPVVINSANAKSDSVPKPPAASNGGVANLRVDSFSYLNTSGDHGFVFNVPKPIQTPPNNSFTFPREMPKDNEISVFGADKYFNAIDGMIRPEPSKQPLVNLQNPRVRPSSLCSEASTLNSRTVLIRNGSNTEHRKASRRSAFFARFGCQGPCFDKKAVSIKDDSCNSIPNQVQVQIPGSGAGNIEESRNSIEVFGSGMMVSSKGDVAANLERKLSMLTWDAIPKGSTPLAAAAVAASTVRTISTVCDDMASDASSDLFEIENITGSMYPMLTAPEADVASCLSPASQYAPSEASIQWSVVTASAADYSSVISECCNNDERASVNNVLSRNNSRNHTNGLGPKGRAGGLLGCKSQKAVDVAENLTVRYKNNGEKVKS